MVSFKAGAEGEEVVPTLVANVSGVDHNCLLRCFGLFNRNLQDGEEARSRPDYMEYLQVKATRSPEFAGYIERGCAADVDESIQEMTSAAEYLTYLSDPGHMIPYGALDEGGEAAGLSVALAYISDVNVRIYTVAGGVNSQVLSWDHPNEEVALDPARTLHIIHGRAHYQLMSLSLGREAIGTYSDYAKHNAWISWQHKKELEAKSAAFIEKMNAEGW